MLACVCGVSECMRELFLLTATVALVGDVCEVFVVVVVELRGPGSGLRCNKGR